MSSLWFGQTQQNTHTHYENSYQSTPKIPKLMRSSLSFSILRGQGYFVKKQYKKMFGKISFEFPNFCPCDLAKHYQEYSRVSKTYRNTLKLHSHCFWSRYLAEYHHIYQNTHPAFSFFMQRTQKGIDQQNTLESPEHSEKPLSFTHIFLVEIFTRVPS